MWVLREWLVSGTVFALWGIAFALVSAPQNAFNLVPPAAGLVGAYVAIFLLESAGWTITAACLASLSVAILFGLVAHVGLVARLQNNSDSTRAMLLGTLGILGVTQSAIAMFFGSEMVSVRTTADGAALSARLFSDPAVVPVHACLVLLLCSLIALITSGTSPGLAYRAACDNRQAAAFYMLPLRRIDFAATCAACFVAGLAGLITIGGAAATPLSGTSFAVAGLAASILGGRRSILAAAAGGFILGGVEVLALWGLPSSGRQGLIGLAIVLVLLFRPQGVFGHLGRVA